MRRVMQDWVRCQQVKLLLRRGMNLMQQGNGSAAVTTFSQALAQSPDLSEGYLQRGCAYLQQEMYDRAIADFSAAIALSPHCVEAYRYRGLARYEQNDVPGALSDWEQALHHDPTDAIVHYNRGLVYAQQGQYGAALADFDAALGQNPLLAEAYLHRGCMKQRLGDLTGAIQDWELAVCNDLRLEEAQTLLAQVRQLAANASLQKHFADLLPDGVSLSATREGEVIVLQLRRSVGTPLSYFTLSDRLRDRLIDLQLPAIRRFRLIAKAGDSSLSEWDQTYPIYDKAPCPPARWRDALITTLLLFPPFGVLALVLAAQVKPAYQRGDYPSAMSASRAVRKLFLSSSVIMGVMLFGLASYGVHTYVEGDYPNPSAKTAYRPPQEFPQGHPKSFQK